MEIIFEAKFEIDFVSENFWAEKLGLDFQREYFDTDIYIDGEPHKSRKLKILKDDEIIFYEVIFNEVFEITGNTISKDEKNNLFSNSKEKLEIDRKKRVYLWKKVFVKVDFDYMKQFPKRLFMEIHSNNKSDVLMAKEFVEALGLKLVEVPYDKLLKISTAS